MQGTIRPLGGAVLRYGQTMSLDVVLGVIGGGLFAVALTGAAMPPVWWLLLPASAWAVYSLDRLLDARRLGPGAHAFRHRFYYRHRNALAFHTSLILVLILSASLWLLPGVVLVTGFVLSAAASAHLLLAQRNASGPVPKELSAAAIYTAGIWFAPLMLGDVASPWIVVAVALHFLAALLNLLLFSLFERRVDRLDRHASIARSWGLARTRRWIYRLAALGISAALVAMIWGPANLRLATPVLLSLVCAPLLMLRYPSFFARGERYRTYGDLLFVLLGLPTAVSSVFLYGA